jgi:hypothetical protein
VFLCLWIVQKRTHPVLLCCKHLHLKHKKQIKLKIQSITMTSYIMGKKTHVSTKNRTLHTFQFTFLAQQEKLLLWYNKTCVPLTSSGPINQLSSNYSWILYHYSPFYFRQCLNFHSYCEHIQFWSQVETNGTYCEVLNHMLMVFQNTVCAMVIFFIESKTWQPPWIYI